MKILVYIELNFGSEGIQRGLENGLATTLYDAVNLKNEMTHLISADLFPPAHQIDTKKFEILEPLLVKHFTHISRVLAIVVIEGLIIKVHWRDRELRSDEMAMKSLADKLYAIDFRHHLGIVMTVQE